MVVSYFLSESGKNERIYNFIENREVKRSDFWNRTSCRFESKMTEEILNEVKTLKIDLKV
ncbi:putative conjugative transfer protein TraB [Orientia tsutsugamushi str. Gilliam]|uniref:Putative conjugative transfer protein TraB n=1 Tax=Orientia tsutsugamushi str. Gilliam TaxID=1359184 RepID=A0A0F3M4L9_ORITS|nr:putative conjugative transfer protein TraB [Orientia tsutsugamushi str. Gilliam]